MDIRYRYLPPSALSPGMILGKPLQVVERGRVCLRMQDGHEITESCITQLLAHHAECVCIVEEESRSKEERQAEWQKQEARMAQIFRFADLDNPQVRAFYDALLHYRKR